MSLSILIGRGLDLRKANVKKRISKEEIDRSGQYEVLKVRSVGRDTAGSAKATEGDVDSQRVKPRFPVIMARRSHLFPFRTQKLSFSASKVPGW